MKTSRMKVKLTMGHLTRRTKRLKLSKMATWMMKRQRDRIQHLIITGFVKKHSSSQRKQRSRISRRLSVVTGLLMKENMNLTSMMITVIKSTI